MKHLFLIPLIALAFTIKSAAFASCPKCDIEKVTEVSDNIDSLTLELTQEFFCTFDESCSNNVEFSEWSNKVLFNLLEHKPELFLTVLETQTPETKNLIIQEIENPIHEFELQEIYRKVESSSIEGALKERILSSLLIAAKKQGN